MQEEKVNDPAKTPRVGRSCLKKKKSAHRRRVTFEEDKANLLGRKRPSGRTLDDIIAGVKLQSVPVTAAEARKST